MELDSKRAYVLSNLCVVVERILSFLPTKALLRAACVCRLWRECARRLLRTQQSIEWVSALEPGPSDSHSLVRALAEELENVHVLPQTVLYIADAETFSGHEECHGQKRARKRNSKETAVALEKLLPKRCQVLGMVAPGIVGSLLKEAAELREERTLIHKSRGVACPGRNPGVSPCSPSHSIWMTEHFLLVLLLPVLLMLSFPDTLHTSPPAMYSSTHLLVPYPITPMGSSTNQPQEIEDGEAGFALLFPKIDGVKIHTFHFFKDLKNRVLDESKFTEAGLKNNPELRVVLLFVYNSWKPGANRFLHQIMNCLNEKSIILAGGHVESLTSLISENNAEAGNSCGVVGLAFSGPQLQSATVLLDQDVIDERTVEAAMQRLKAANIPEQNTIGFMFACVGRGYQYYKTKRNLEADAFRKFFPNVPLFGFFGHGEIGCDRIVTGNFILRECNDIKDDLLHGYTTVMTLIHLGSTKANQV